MSDLFAYNTAIQIQSEALWCGSCNIPYGLPAGFLDERRRDELARPAWSKHLLSPSGMDWTEPLAVPDAVMRNWLAEMGEVQ